MRWGVGLPAPAGPGVAVIAGQCRRQDAHATGRRAYQLEGFTNPGVTALDSGATVETVEYLRDDGGLVSRCSANQRECSAGSSFFTLRQHRCMRAN